MLLRLQRYDLELKHYSGKSIPVVDTLSRKYVSDTYPTPSHGMDLHVHFVIYLLPISDRKLTEIRSPTEKDATLIILAQTIMSGFPENVPIANQK